MIAYDPACRYRSLQNAGDANFFGQKARRVQGRDSLNKHAFVFYDFNEGLPCGLQSSNPFDDGAEPIQIRLLEWRRLKNGLTLFREAEFHQAGELWTYQYTKTEVNSLRPEDFDPPN